MFAPLVLASGIKELPPPFDLDRELIRLSIQYNIDEDLARRIIQCESQFVEDAVGRDAVVGTDHSYWQFNSHYWEQDMLERGWDIYDPQDNLEAGFWLLSRDGTKHWNASKGCWQRLG